ncbi:MAG TPA: ATP-binding protein, partial [Caldimonas sp.]|nr:ATP-binding protein [Caldimonas sp.]
ARAARFLRFAQGEPSHNLLAAVLPELRGELRSVLFQAAQGHARIDAAPIPLVIDGRRVQVRTTAQAVRHPDWPAEMLMVTFDEATIAEDVDVGDSHDGAEVGRLQVELHRKSDQLRTTIEQYETSAEELKASNEELQAINEELRSATEELETSKEELQSTNEELITVNQELKTKIDETIEINDDLRNLIGSTDIATVFVDPDMRIKRFTPAAAAIFNIIAGDIGRPLFDITHRLDYGGLADDARAVFSSLKSIEREVASDDGRRLLARLLPYRTAEDRIGGAVLTFVDVTSLRQAEAGLHIGEERMRLIAETMTDFAILTLDLEGRFTGWSAGAERLFGYAADEVVGDSFDILFSPEDRERGAAARELRIARTSGRAPDERWMQRKDGSLFYASGVTTPLRAEGVEGYAKICRDMTHIRTAAQTQAMRLDEAEQGRERARADAAMKAEFLAVMSHELKHPLNLISVNAQLLTVLPEAQGLPAVQRAAQTIQRTVQGQGRVIDDLLDMSRTNVGKLAVNRVPLLIVEAIQPCMTWALAESRRKGVRLFVEGLDDPVMIDGDPVRIEQICWNLLSNAIKFTPQRGSITVRLSRDGEDALLCVEDTGRGIAPEFLPQIFEMFKQEESARTRVEGGLGIGLALARSLVELHGGRITAESAGPGLGASFKVWLPLHQRTGFSPLDEAASPPSGWLAGLRVLVVDDTPDALETFAFLLEYEGATVVQAQSAAEALRLADNQDFDLLISDIGMPQMDGYELIAELRSRPRTATLPSIALTGYGSSEDRQRALSAGFDAHLDKPVELDQLRVVVAAVRAAAANGTTASPDVGDGASG